MTALLKDIEATVLRLPEDDRVRLLECLLESLEPEVSPENAWLEESQQRRRDVLAGVVNMVPGDEALARVRAQIAP